VGSKLTVLAALIALGGTAQSGPADDAMKKGIELYKAGKYADAIPHLERAHKLDGKPDTLFALAQAQRLAGDCRNAAQNYKKVIEQVSDFTVAKLVQQNLTLCEPDEPKPAVTSEPREELAASAEPRVVEQTVVREVRRTDKVAAVMFGGGMLALGAAGGFYVAASNNADAADRARSLEDHDLLADRATTQRTIVYVAGGLGAAMIGFAVFRWTRGSSTDRAEATTDVAVVPTSGGGALWVTSRF
jgi:tetratricopeptide (TPR) repeat protein